MYLPNLPTLAKLGKQSSTKQLWVSEISLTCLLSIKRYKISYTSLQYIIYIQECNFKTIWCYLSSGSIFARCFSRKTARCSWYWLLIISKEEREIGIWIHTERYHGKWNLKRGKRTQRAAAIWWWAIWYGSKDKTRVLRSKRKKN